MTDPKLMPETATDAPPPPAPIAKPNPQAMNIMKNSLGDAEVERRQKP